MKTRNLTLALPEDLLKKLKIVAAKRESSISALVRASLESIAQEEESRFQQSWRELRADMERGYNLGLGDKIPWTRDEIHERR